MSPNVESRAMFVARLRNIQETGERWLDGERWMKIDDVLALLSDCDMLASMNRTPAGMSEPAEAGDVFRSYWENIDTKRSSYGNSRDDFVAGWNSARALTPPSSEKP